jgi:sulfhydrogenase subunit beta (sulfur reductase)
MNTAILKKENLAAFLKSLNARRLIAPVAKKGKTSFELIEDATMAKLDLNDYLASPKKVVFPQTETLFAFKKQKNGVKVAPADRADTTVVFGIRPCDARSFQILDNLFKGDFNDPYYGNKREHTLLIGLACKEPTNRCFCPSLGGSPSSTEGLDVLFTDIGDEYYLHIVTDRARSALSQAAALLSEPDAEHQDKKEQADKAAQAKIRRTVNLDGMHEKLPRIFEHEVWMELANKCLGCGICTYYCPTCHCFDIQDEGDVTEGRRIRVWDSCMFEEFTRHASGVNPRHSRAERLRNRIMHKFSYYPANLGAIACVGCGRCIELCPVNEDIIEILNTVRNVHE